VEPPKLVVPPELPLVTVEPPALLVPPELVVPPVLAVVPALLVVEPPAGVELPGADEPPVTVELTGAVEPPVTVELAGAYEPPAAVELVGAKAVEPPATVELAGAYEPPAAVEPAGTDEPPLAVVPPAGMVLLGTDEPPGVPDEVDELHPLSRLAAQKTTASKILNRRDMEGSLCAMTIRPFFDFRDAIAIVQWREAFPRLNIRSSSTLTTGSRRSIVAAHKAPKPLGHHCAERQHRAPAGGPAVDTGDTTATP
jgi:hypothetical protein